MITAPPGSAGRTDEQLIIDHDVLRGAPTPRRRRGRGAWVNGLASETLCRGLCGGPVLLIAAAYVAGTRRRPPRHGTIHSGHRAAGRKG
jgi:hypothetical protein